MAACTADSMNRQFICEFLGLLTDSAFTSGSLQPAGSVSLWLPLALDSLPSHSAPAPALGEASRSSALALLSHSGTQSASSIWRDKVWFVGIPAAGSEKKKKEK